VQDRIGAISFHIKGAHYNLVVKLLNDKYGIQLRGGCSCAGTYGHYLFGIEKEDSKRITDQIDSGILCDKPGWIRLSLHPTMTNLQVQQIADAVVAVAQNHSTWLASYQYNTNSNEFDPLQNNTHSLEEWMLEAFG
jgi:selenocysteine lyase/cysteine desulfurase